MSVWHAEAEDGTVVRYGVVGKSDVIGTVEGGERIGKGEGVGRGGGRGGLGLDSGGCGGRGGRETRLWVCETD